MKKIFKKSCIFTVLAAMFITMALLITACMEPVITPGNGIPEGKSGITLTIVSPNPLTILPTIPAIAVYEVIATGTGAEGTFSDDFTASSGSLVVDPGEYNVEVRAYVTSKAPANLVGLGTSASPVTVTSGATPVSIQLRELITAATGRGNLAWNFTKPAAPDNFDSIEMTVLTWPGETATSITDVDVSTNDSTGIQIQSGYYYIDITMEKTGHQTRTIRDIAHIFDNMTTTYTQTFTALNENEYDVTLDDNHTTGGTQTLTGSPFTHGSTLSNPTYTPTRTDGYTFTNWYKEAAATNLWVFGATGDIIIGPTTLYAGWIDQDSLTFTITAIPSPTDSTFTLSDSTIIFSQTDLGSALSEISVVLNNAGIFDTGSIKWTFNGKTLPVTTTTEAGDTLSFDFDDYVTDSDILELLTPGTHYITIEAAISSVPYTATLIIQITP